MHQRVEKYQQQLEAYEHESREHTALPEAFACLDDFTSSIDTNLESADWMLRREILRTLIDRIEVEEEQIQIVYRINFPLFARKASKDGKKRSLHFCWRSNH